MADEQDEKTRMAEAEKRGLSGLTAAPDPDAHPNLTPAAASLREFLLSLQSYLYSVEVLLKGMGRDLDAPTARGYADRARAFADMPYEEFIPATAPKTIYDAECFDK